MIYKTKKELLAKLWKSEKDTRLIDRMISRWEVIVEWWCYILRDEYIDNLHWKVKELEKEKAELKEMLGERSTSIIQAKSALSELSEDDRDEYLKIIKELEWQLAESQIKQEQLEQRNAYLEEKMNWGEDIGDGEEDKSSSNELEEAKIQREYYENKANKYKEAINKVIEVTYNKIRPALWTRIGTLSEFRENILEQVSDLLKD